STAAARRCSPSTMRSTGTRSCSGPPGAPSSTSVPGAGRRWGSTTWPVRAAGGTQLPSGPRGRVVFEIDDFDRDARTGWSVVVAGRLEEVTPYDAETLERVTGLPLAPWAQGDKPHWMRLVPDRITGRRIT